MKKAISLTIVKWVFFTLLLIAFGVKIAILAHNRPQIQCESEENNTGQRAKQHSEDPYQYSRMVLSSEIQTFVVPEGRTYIILPVEDHVTVKRIVNGNIDMGTVEFFRGTMKVKKYVMTDRIQTESFSALPGFIGKSLVFITYPIGHEAPEPNGLVSLAIAKTM